jgi:hypothetical protein
MDQCFISFCQLPSQAPNEYGERLEEHHSHYLQPSLALKVVEIHGSALQNKPIAVRRAAVIREIIMARWSCEL